MSFKSKKILNFFPQAKIFILDWIKAQAPKFQTTTFQQLIKGSLCCILLGWGLPMDEPMIGSVTGIPSIELGQPTSKRPEKILTTIGKDRSLRHVLLGASVDPSVTKKVTASIPKHLSMSLRPGQKVGLFFKNNALSHVKIYSGISGAWLIQSKDNQVWRCSKSSALTTVGYQRLRLCISESLKKSLIQQGPHRSLSMAIFNMCSKSGIAWGNLRGASVDLMYQTLTNTETKEVALNHIALVRISKNAKHTTYYAHKMALGSKKNQIAFYTLTDMGNVALSGVGSRSGGWCSPVFGKTKITSHFGMRRDPFCGSLKKHGGTDFCGHTGTTIVAMGNGRVSVVGRSSTYGKYIQITHPGGYKTLYAHLTSTDVAQGAIVSKGQRIGKMGSTGRATGPHLHLEVSLNGSKINPMRVLSAASKSALVPSKPTVAQAKKMYHYASVMNAKYLELGGVDIKKQTNMRMAKAEKIKPTILAKKTMMRA